MILCLVADNYSGISLFLFFIVTFDVNFTSGNISGFILFAQILDTLVIHANGTIPFPTHITKLLMVQSFFYRIFNLDFFSLESLSFCLWKHTTVMDIMMMRYVTIGCAFALVILTVLVLRWGKFAIEIISFFHCAHAQPYF